MKVRNAQKYWKEREKSKGLLLGYWLRLEAQREQRKKKYWWLQFSVLGTFRSPVFHSSLPISILFQMPNRLKHGFLNPGSISQKLCYFQQPSQYLCASSHSSIKQNKLQYLTYYLQLISRVWHTVRTKNVYLCCCVNIIIISSLCLASCRKKIELI